MQHTVKQADDPERTIPHPGGEHRASRGPGQGPAGSLSVLVLITAEYGTAVYKKYGPMHRPC